jgi:hypothetical protein
MELSGAVWRKSSHSNATQANCVEVALIHPDVIAMRDSKRPAGPGLTFSPSDWRAFTDRLKAGELGT